MNPYFLKIGITIFSASAAFLIFLINKRIQEVQRKEECNRISTGNYDGNDLKNCCICLAPFSIFQKNDVITLPCKHKLCRKCCKTMFSYQGINNRNCPVCRQLVPEAIVSQIL